MQQPHATYQDVIVNGVVIRSGYGPDCEERYQAIRKNVLSHYKRPFSVLEIGANNGYFGFRALADFNCRYVMIEKLRGLPYICDWNTNVNDRVIVLNTYANDNMLQALTEKEHFDVIIICNLLHHLGDGYKAWIDQAYKMCSHLIIEIPAPNDPISRSKNIELMTQYIKSFPNVKVIAMSARRRGVNHLPLSPMFWISNQSNTFNFNGNKIIKSDWKEKKIIKDLDGKKVSSDWIHGISLDTFFRYAGIFPRYKPEDFSGQDWEHQILKGSETEMIKRK